MAKDLSLQIFKMDENIVEPIDVDMNNDLLSLHEELKNKDKEIERLKTELTKASDLCKKAIKYNEQLKALLSTKHASNQSTCHFGIQVVAEEIDSEVSNEVEEAEVVNEDWLAASEKSQMSVTDCVRAAAEEATRQAGFVYDSTSGYYYDSASGYYYHPEKALYYDPKSGVFFYYNQEAEKYEFHSKIDIPGTSQFECQDSPEEDQKECSSFENEKFEEESKNHETLDENKIASCSRRRSADSSPKSHRYSGRQDVKNGSKRDHRMLINSDDEDMSNWERDLQDYQNDREKWLSNNSSFKRHEHETNNDRYKEKYKHKSRRDRPSRNRKSISDRNRKSRKTHDCDVIEETFSERGHQHNINNHSKEEGECSESSQSDECMEDRESSPDSSNSELRRRRTKAIDELERLVNSTKDFEEELNFKSDVFRYSEDVIESDQSNCIPCIRAIILETGDLSLKCGSLIFITCQGVSIGKEKSCDISIDDVLISKVHAEIVYAKRNRCYAVKDLGSVNGTFLNNILISKTNRHAIEHGDIITFGKTKLLLHIHKGSETCDDCEPGQVQAALAAANPEIKDIKILSREEKEKERKRELKQLRKKYGLSEDPYVDKTQLMPSNSGYTDRAEVRRIEKGSDNPYEKTEAASVDIAISQESKGFKMLEKMGWSSGQSLGKTQEGIREPVQVQGRQSKAGLGLQDDDRFRRKSRKVEQWDKARERYQVIESNNSSDKV